MTGTMLSCESITATALNLTGRRIVSSASASLSTDSGSADGEKDSSRERLDIAKMGGVGGLTAWKG